LSQRPAHDQADELIDFVDEYDVVLGTMGKDAAYKADKRLRIVCILIIDPDTGKIALTRRGATVSWQPLHYSIAACGHVGTGEDWDAAAMREMSEEIGLDVPLCLFDKSPYDDEFGKHFLLSHYIGHATPDRIKASAREVAELRWISVDELRALLEKNEMIHNVSRPTFTKWLETAFSG
jgi:ADP-ribose pyrophosphatase YjhB (NUDIX family)